jgi:hypothetical protein
VLTQMGIKKFAQSFDDLPAEPSPLPHPLRPHGLRLPDHQLNAGWSPRGDIGSCSVPIPAMCSNWSTAVKSILATRREIRRRACLRCVAALTARYSA